MANITIEINNAYLNKLKGKLYGLLCEREKQREWVKFYDNIIIELMGFPEEHKTINYIMLIYKLNSCRYLSFAYFRTTILECINLIGTLEA